MSRRALVIALALAACQTNRRVDVLLGPNAQTPSIGFRCLDSNNIPVLARAITGNDLVVQIVIDLVDLDGHVPSCLGEDIVTTCASATCGPRVADQPQRFCKTMTITDAIRMTPTAITNAAVTWLHDNAHEVTASAPHRPLLVRVVATQQPCAQVMQAAGDRWIDLDKPSALGCAYSCPVQLDAVDGPVSLGLDVLDAATCVPTMQACARFPGS